MKTKLERSIYFKNYYKINKKEYGETQKRYRQRNLSKIREYEQKYKARRNLLKRIRYLDEATKKAKKKNVEKKEQLTLNFD
jgi:hypothetical protein